MKENKIQKALKNLSEAAKSLSVHGAKGYDTDSSALDYVFLRNLKALLEALHIEENSAYFDPDWVIYNSLTDGL